MPSGILPIDVVIDKRGDSVTGRGGLVLVLETMRALGLDKAVEGHVRVRPRNSGFTDAEKVEAFVLLMAAGGDCIDDVRLLAADEGLCRLLGRTLPSADTLLTFLYAFHDEWSSRRATGRKPPSRCAPSRSGSRRSRAGCSRRATTPSTSRS